MRGGDVSQSEESAKEASDAAFPGYHSRDSEFGSDLAFGHTGTMPPLRHTANRRLSRSLSPNLRLHEEPDKAIFTPRGFEEVRSCSDQIPRQTHSENANACPSDSLTSVLSKVGLSEAAACSEQMLLRRPHNSGLTKSSIMFKTAPTFFAGKDTTWSRDIVADFRS